VVSAAEHGGRRAGQGSSTERARIAKRQAAAQTRAQSALERVTDEQIDQVIQALLASAQEGNPAALKLLIEQLKGRAPTQAPVETDLTIVVNTVAPRPGSAMWKVLEGELCSKCRAKLIGWGRRREK
jgi:hypothetical protein